MVSGASVVIWQGFEVYSLVVRLVPIMLLNLAIMLWSNAPEFCLLCSNYGPYVSQCSPLIEHFLSFILIMSISSLYLFIFQILCNLVHSPAV